MKTRKDICGGPETDAIDYGTTDAMPALVLSGTNLLLKELIHVGSFAKYDQKSGKKLYEFSVTPELLRHWKSTNDEMISEVGADAVPMPLEHTTDPDKNRAYVRGMSIGRNSKGKEALFGHVEFCDPADRKLAKSTNVSIHVPPQVVRQIEGKKKTYHRPIQHVALTNYPVIANLDGFTSIAASLYEGDISMGTSLADLAQRLGVETDSTEDDQVLADKLVDVYASMKARLDAKDAQTPAGDEDLPELDDEDPLFGDPEEVDPEVDQEAQADGEDKDKVTKLPKAIAASLTRVMTEARKTKLGSMVGKSITKAVHDDLVKEYCSPEAISLSLSDEEANDGFERMIGILSKNVTVRLGEKTGAQTSVALSSVRDESGEPVPGQGSLSKAAEKRAQEAGATNGHAVAVG